jgi:hypothetical protein
LRERAFPLLQRTPGGTAANFEGGPDMLWTIAVVLVVLWLLSTVTRFAVGGFIHLLLLAGVAIAVVAFFRNGNPF